MPTGNSWVKTNWRMTELFSKPKVLISTLGDSLSTQNELYCPVRIGVAPSFNFDSESFRQSLAYEIEMSKQMEEAGRTFNNAQQATGKAFSKPDDEADGTLPPSHNPPETLGASIVHVVSSIAIPALSVPHIKQKAIRPSSFWTPSAIPARSEGGFLLFTRSLQR
ncbi:hypothetical protein C8R44DRAFT_727199 [Mycena epipterygia]|nr:hypothetical protein C8R44DRAFT_727199 [Mycena epipterygia]